MKKKILSLVLASTMLASAAPSTVFAVDMEQEAEIYSENEEIGEDSEEKLAGSFEKIEDENSADYANEVINSQQQEKLEEENEIFSDGGGEIKSDVVISGSLGENITWTLNEENHELVIQGNGNMPDFSEENPSPWASYGIKHVVIKKGVTSIGAFAFFDKSIISVDIPEGVTSIGESAFSCCMSLKNIDIPEGVTDIGKRAFQACEITRIVLPKGITKIADYLFYQCNSLAYVDIPEGVVSIGSSAFVQCSSIESIKLPETILNIGGRAFEDCTSLTKINLPPKIESIEDHEFENCINLKEIIIPENVNNIGKYAFAGCSSLKNIIIPENVINVGEAALYKCSNLVDVTISKRINKIAKSMFQECSNISNIVIPDGITVIEDNAFFACNGLKSITIPKEITDIGDQAFEDCSEDMCVKYLGTKADWEKVNKKYARLEDKKIYYLNEIHEHEYIKLEEVLPTCIKSGTKKYICDICGEEKEEEIPATGHSWNGGEITKKATCTEAGEKKYICTVCGENRIEEIKAEGHKEVVDEEVIPSCTESGVTEGSHCSVCGKVLTEQKTIPATGHDWDTGKITKEATCEETGEKTYTCANCGAIKTEEIKAFGHKEVQDAAVESTCTKTGKTEGSHCSVCGKIFKEQEETVLKAHTFTAWKTTTAATVLAPAKQTRKCNVCGKTETRNYGSSLKPSIKVNTGSILLKTNQKTTILRVSGLAKGDAIISWKSSNTSIVKVYGRTNGTCTIQAGNRSGKATITVMLRSKLKKNIVVTVQKTTVKTTKITGVPTKLSLKKNQSSTLRPTLYPMTSGEKVTYQSSNTKIATVNSKGQVKAKNKGTAIITVKSGRKSVKCRVIVR